jgi:hypothetical protein
MIKISRKQVDAYEKRVDAGIRWLNKNKPGWVASIDTRTLNLESAGVCVLGQLFNGFWQDVQDVSDTTTGRLLSRPKAVKLGFAEDEAEKEDYDLLTFIWAHKIRALKETF